MEIEFPRSGIFTLSGMHRGLTLYTNEKMPCTLLSKHFKCSSLEILILKFY